MTFQLRASLLLALPLLAVLPSTFAGKAERDFVSQEVEPARQATAAAIQKSCGCAIKFDVKTDGYADVDGLRTARNFVKAVGEHAPGYCTDAPSKAAVCKLKTVEVSKGNSAAFQFTAGKGVVTTDSSSYPSWDMITAQIDK